MFSLIHPVEFHPIKTMNRIFVRLNLGTLLPFSTLFTGDFHGRTFGAIVFEQNHFEMAWACSSREHIQRESAIWSNRAPHQPFHPPRFIMDPCRACLLGDRDSGDTYGKSVPHGSVLIHSTRRLFPSLVRQTAGSGNCRVTGFKQSCSRKKPHDRINGCRKNRYPLLSPHPFAILKHPPTQITIHEYSSPAGGTRSS